MTTVDFMERIDNLLRLQADNYPAAIFLIEGDLATTYATADRAADSIATWLQEKGVGKNDRVVIWGDNSTNFLLAVFGVLRAGASVVPMHARTSLPTALQVLNLAEPALVLADRRVFSAFELACVQPLIALDELDFLPVGKPKPSGAGPACIIFTSGSTGIPRGVVCGHREILFAIHAINLTLAQTRHDRVLCCLPFSFDYGLYQAFLVAEVGATMIVIPSHANPLNLPLLLRQYRITGFPLVPSIAAILLRSRMLERLRPNTLRYTTNTGDLLPSRHAERLAEHLGGMVVPMYGLTECKRVAIMPLDRLTDKRGSVGLPLPSTRVDLLHSAEFATLGGDAGELLVHGRHVMGGYWRAPEATSERFRVSSGSGDIVLHTGDIFRRDIEGFLFFLGRRDTLIRRDNVTLGPTEIEQKLADVDGVAETAIAQDPNGTVHAFIVTDALPESIQVTIKNILADNLSSVLIPFIIRFVRKLPRTLNGKIDRINLLTYVASLS
jgi:long-chain acyl-CoA synthetase